LGARLLQFVIENQNPDGSWNYDVPLAGSALNIDGRSWSPNIDGFHTGMVISALAQMIPFLKDGELRSATVRALLEGFRFYIDNLVLKDGTPMYALNKLYPIDPYSCGQAIISLVDACECESLDPQIRERAERLLDLLADQTIKLMLEPDGSFLTARYRFRSIRLKSLRWAQAVLALAFARYGKFLSRGLETSGASR